MCLHQKVADQAVYLDPGTRFGVKLSYPKARHWKPTSVAIHFGGGQPEVITSKPLDWSARPLEWGQYVVIGFFLGSAITLVILALLSTANIVRAFAIEMTQIIKSAVAEIEEGTRAKLDHVVGRLDAIISTKSVPDAAARLAAQESTNPEKTVGEQKSIATGKEGASSRSVDDALIIHTASKVAMTPSSYIADISAQVLWQSTLNSTSFSLPVTVFANPITQLPFDHAESRFNTRPLKVALEELFP